VFFGEHEHSLDDKGRITVPAAFRPHLADGVFVIRGPDCLVAFPRSWFEEKVAPKLRRNPVSSNMPRIVNSGSALELDSSGRLLIPPALRRWAGLDLSGAAVVVGNDRHVEIWSRPGWDTFLSRSMSNADLTAGLRELGL
jgi:MraZ protein